ncbi:MAG TPA: ABC transporter ATP-binding protein [Alphaproteobacteria bacterium]
MSDAAVPLLDVRALSKNFGGVQALDRLSLTVNRNEALGIVGPNGAGKTVLVNCVTGFYRPNAGRISFLGRDITGLPLHVIGRLGVARTFQNIRLFRRMTVLENVIAASHDWIARPLRSLLAPGGGAGFTRPALELLERVRLADKADSLAGSLAYGEARRLEIARALATRPKLLLLDEPSAGMNEQETEELAADIKNNSDLFDSVVIIEHDIGFIRALSDRIVAMDYGRKIAEGSAEEVFSDPQVVDAYLGAEHAHG